MVVAHSLQTAVEALRRNPVIAGITVLLALFQLPLQFVPLAAPSTTIIASAVSLVATVLVLPFIFGGIFGMADEALDGTTNFGTFVEMGKRHYTSMLGAYLLLLGGSIVFGTIAWVVVGLGTLVAIIPVFDSPQALFPVLLLIMVVGSVLFLLLFLIPFIFIQFYGQAIVFDDEGAFSSFFRSVSIVRQNFWPVVGYSVVVFGISLVFGFFGSLPASTLSSQLSPSATNTLLSEVLSGVPQISIVASAALTLFATILMGLSAGLLLTFSVAFYRSLATSDNADDANDAAVRGTSA
ncbi:hypothetical protein C499_08572 [Halogeometricum borinquense DSM 11551]|uniref:DUF7847 domain-containing protein n=1 Tax=Halogeometricum borinquense (strain ATCC 700274 / DSM 11551 / JCM 10706 / KCTC 4070 / PR3) TaxID=469382 RepID=E4NMH4_HALBP|nr:hypothetical protein [Halogeometricum borinquense]ADQ68472.1 hypothetical protein Hbor_29330 [Halogeometricum borinquense DSM 11551]ELY27884.1 hypothetical protein C499_08572 [Halogeometricum borinquense DSM 11551]